MAGRVTPVAGVGTANKLGLQRFEPFLAWIASLGGHPPAKDTVWLGKYVAWMEKYRFAYTKHYFFPRPII